MFENIGNKIMGLASFITWVGIILSVISGCIIISESPLSGILIICVGSLISWISSFVLYGFGKIVTVSERIDMIIQQKSADDIEAISKQTALTDIINNLKKDAANNVLTEEEYETLNSLEWSRKEGIISEAEYNKRVQNLIK